MGKKPPAFPESCSQCRFFMKEEARASAGYCRRNPPVFCGIDEDESVAMFTFPIVGETEWCGASCPSPTRSLHGFSSLQ